MGRSQRAHPFHQIRQRTEQEWRQWQSTGKPEVAGVLLATHLITTVQENTMVDNTTIFMDSQAAISRINHRSKGASREPLKVTQKAIREARNSSGGTTIHLEWCLGHAGVPGNELADEEPCGPRQDTLTHLNSSPIPHRMPPNHDPTTHKQVMKAH
ncbi:hypothetical protein B0J17DRAFT_630631 [Rhizoctonia solani]|nr:hypothetical protein B0J17DRAFT_630631 [Rhizoctonia solani]